jgi:hypothetical protein
MPRRAEPFSPRESLPRAPPSRGLFRFRDGHRQPADALETTALEDDFRALPKELGSALKEP